MKHTVDVEGVIHRETDRAILFSTDDDEDNAEWIALASIEIERNDETCVITLTERLAIIKGLV